MTQKALFLDRDGVINVERNYLYLAEDVVWVEGIFPLCRAAVEHGYKLVVVTNQTGIGRGFYTEDNFHQLMQWMRAEFVAQGTPLDAVYFCPYHPREGIGKYKQEHEDRKPGPGMLRRAAEDLGLELARSIMVGDRCSDVGAANAAGLRHAFLIAGTEDAACSGSYTPVFTLQEVTDWLEAESV